jgi:hypothetical protein
MRGPRKTLRGLRRSIMPTTLKPEILWTIQVKGQPS